MRLEQTNISVMVLEPTDTTQRSPFDWGLLGLWLYPVLYVGAMFACVYLRIPSVALTPLTLGWAVWGWVLSERVGV